MSWYTLPPTTSLSAGSESPVFAYIDNGEPLIAAVPYTTIVATYGLAYNAHTFSRVLALAPKHNFRIVAVNRRCYGGSTSFAQEQMSALPTAPDEEKAIFVRATGIDFAAFVDRFIRANNIPPTSPDGKSGGIAILGWSAGYGVVISALANLEHMLLATQALFKSHVRRLVMQEPPPLSPGAWFFEMDGSIPQKHRRRMGTNWITSYFNRGDLSTRDRPFVLSHLVPSISTRAPSIYNMSQQEFVTIVGETVSELEVMAFCGK
ncbi:hypothetical protein BDY19DRAFT_925175 [Irpex rosettiformis]|uniref:Uncharacterized protein n=1 Tax=Irpex rosettiformis TaxID=378272 RepID=A0ACB8UEF1_9APHY|nr:hypothetical protein BDY19DRAFT_925175 [Irpex rosettiformis]